MRIHLHKLLSAVVLSLATVSIGYGRAAILSDGPYVRKSGEGFEILRVVEGSPEWENSATGRFTVTSSDGRHRFEVAVGEKSMTPGWDWPRAEKMTLISDPHGDMDSFVSILRSSGVMDGDYRWNYGAGHLFVLGDVFDRGSEVLPIFWLIYKLSGEAVGSGGAVHFLLGNHEDMVLGGDLRYTDPKYTGLAEKLGIGYRELWSPEWTLGEWLATRNFVERVGGDLFVHAGLSEKMVEMGLDAQRINTLMREGLHSDRDARSENREAGLLFGMNGPLWYRGMVESAGDHFDPIDMAGVNRVLEFFGARRIVVGHTPMNEVTMFFDDKVVGVNVDSSENLARGGSFGVQIENGKLSILKNQ